MLLDAIVSLLIASAPAFAEQPQVSTELGALKGKRLSSLLGRTFYGFEGVPYAKPPVGEYRFKQAVPVTPWVGVLNATRIPSMCLQIPSKLTLDNFPLDVVGSEDCLYLNIYTPMFPSEVPDGKLLDVIVHLHGGAFQVLSGDIWGPRHLLDRDIVFVNLNYRLGVFGFISLEDDVCPGNNGLWDQNLALKWVNQHIAAFGGNPNSVTITGFSAGGASVHFHMLSGQSKGLFQRAIANSGVGLNPWAITENPRDKALTIAKSLGCPTDSSEVIIECLRNRPAEHIIVISKGLNVWVGSPVNMMGPVIEKPSVNAFIDQQPIDLIKSKTFNDVPVIFSHTNDEGSIFATPLFGAPELAEELDEKWDDILPYMFNYYETMDPSKKQEIGHIIRKYYLGEKSLWEGVPEFVRATSERYFISGIQQTAMLHAEYQSSPVYAYRFSYPGENGSNPINEMFQIVYEGKAPHGYDLIFLYSTNFQRLDQNYIESIAMSKTIIDYYMDFINETSTWSTVQSGLPTWKYIDIVGPERSQNVFKHEQPTSLQFWDKLKLKENSLERITST